MTKLNKLAFGKWKHVYIWNGLAFAFLLAATPAAAHPHVWSDISSQLLVSDDGKITGVRMEWKTDKNYAKDALDGMDTNNDGIYEPEELAKLTEENLSALSEYDYFVSFRFNGTKQKNGKAVDGKQIYNPTDGRLTLDFTVPLESPLDPRTGEIQLKIYDPEFFIDFEYVKEKPLYISKKLPDGCSAKLLPVPTDTALDQTKQMLATKGKDWKPMNDEDFGSMFAQPAIVRCGS